MPTPLSISDEKIKELVYTFNTPLQIYDGNLILKNQQKFIDTMTNNFIGFRQYFAVKALPNPNILKLLIDNGSYLDCSSKVELMMASNLGLKGEKIMFTSNYTSKEDLKFAKELGAIINLDDISLIDDLASLGTNGQLPELLCFRLNPGIGKTDSETVSNVLGGPDAKFGIPPFQIVEAYQKAKKLGVKRFGLHMMTGSNVLNFEYWDELIKILFENLTNIQKMTEVTIEFINIGGGIGIPYKPDQPKFDVDKLSNLLRSSINREIQRYGISEPRLCMENGRFITGPYGWLVSKCNVIKNTYQKYYGLDACMANLMRPGMYGAYHHISVVGKENKREKEKEREKELETEVANVVGTLCENNDWFAKDRELVKAEVGDLFVIYDTGAHSHSMGFQYNGKLRAPEILISGGGEFIKYIRRRETIEDYLLTVVI